MPMRKLFCNLLAALSMVAAGAGAQAAPKVGVAAAVKNNVQGVLGATTRSLSAGSDVFTNERIRTGEASAAQILFLDKTTLTVGPRAELTLDRFVYNPSRSTGQVVLNVIRGAVRFVSGSQNPRSYTIKTPVGTLGVRGTIVELIAQNGQVIVILVSGSLVGTFNGQTFSLTVPGTALVFNADGSVQGPIPYDGTIHYAGADVGIPMYGWYFQGEPLNNGVPDLNIGGIDQLNGIIQGALTPPPPPPPPPPDNF
jgi:hypothetical protein